MVKKKIKNNLIAKKIIDSEKTFVGNLVHPIHQMNRLTLGQRSADAIAKWAGSWTFIISFFIFLGLWMLTNIYAWVNQWDPYPFILLNLVLSTLAAVQAPVILMSQNRAAQRDRQRSEYDYAVNRKAERGIQELQKQLNRIEGKLK